MYDVHPNTIIGFYVCDLSVRNNLITNPNTFEVSSKLYDWSGYGFYFWENNYARAQYLAEDEAARLTPKG